MAVKVKKPQLGRFDQNTPEVVGDIVSGVQDSFRKDLLERSVNDAWEQLLGIEHQEKSKKSPEAVAGDLVEGEEIELAVKEKASKIEAGYDYKTEILHFEQKATKKENREVKAEIEEIRAELVKLVKSSQELQGKFETVTVESLPVAAGKYHLNFFDFVRSEISKALMNVKEAATWMNVVTHKADRKSYWSLAKKHGTSYSLSGERVVSTQVG